MILRRFMKHVSDQNWFAVGLDVLVVITGIFLGMQVTEWNEDRKNAYLELNYLQRLLEDIDQNADWINDQLVLEKAARADLEWLRGELLKPAPPAGQPDPLYSRQVQHSMILNLDFSMGTLDELISSGRLPLISNIYIREQLQAVRGFSGKLEKSLEYNQSWAVQIGIRLQKYESAIVTDDGRVRRIDDYRSERGNMEFISIIQGRADAMTGQIDSKSSMLGLLQELRSSLVCEIDPECELVRQKQ